MKTLSLEQILYMHTELIKATGGDDGIRDESLLSSALANPFQSFDGVYLYPTLREKAARLAYGIVSNHPFVDGNKRIGVLTMLVFLELNNIFLNYTDTELVSLGLGIAEGSIKTNDILEWILSH